MDCIFGWAPKLFKSRVNYALMWILRILVPIKFCIGPIKLSNGPLKFGNLHVFELDVGHHHFGLGLSLESFIQSNLNFISDPGLDFSNHHIYLVI